MSDDQEPTAGVQPSKGTRAIKDRNQRIREEAARKRRDRRERESEVRRAAVQRNLGAGELVDDALARGTHAATTWLKRHLNVIQWVVVVVVAGGIGWEIYTVHKHKVDAKATDALFAAQLTDRGRVGGDAEVEPDPRTGIGDPRPHFSDESARLTAAASAYRAAGGTQTVKSLAQLALAGVLYDAGKYKEALGAYQSARQSQLAQKDADVRYRSIEGIGLAQESLGDKDAAKKAFHELSNSDDAIFSALGFYHQARLALGTGDKDGAKDLLKKAMDKAAKREEGAAEPTYVTQASRELLASIDPAAAAAAAASTTLTPEQIAAITKATGGGEGSSGGLSKEKLEELMRQLKQHPPQPAPAPSSAPASEP